MGGAKSTPAKTDKDKPDDGAEAKKDEKGKEVKLGKDGKPLKDGEVEKQGKNKEPVVLELDSDEVVACFNDVDESDVGLKFVYEKEAELIKDIRLMPGFFTELENAINKAVTFPENLESIEGKFKAEFEKQKSDMLGFFYANQNITFKDLELRTFAEAEIKHPLLSKNKHQYIKLTLKQVKNFVGNLKLLKRLHYDNCKMFIIDNHREAGMSRLLDTLVNEIKKNNMSNKYWIESVQSDDLVLESYKVFDHNVNATLKLMLLFYEKNNIQYKLLSKAENKINYNILVNNFIFWSITNLERTNFPVYKLYISELIRLNHQINQKIGRNQLVALILQYRGESFQLFRKLRELKEDIEQNIFLTPEKTSTVLHRPLKEKFNHNFKILIRETLPLIYNKYPKYKVVVEKIVESHFDDFFNSTQPPFHIKTLVKLNKPHMTDRSLPPFILGIYKLLLYEQSSVYRKNFSLDQDQFKKRTNRLFNTMSLQITDATLEEMRSIRDIVLDQSHQETFEALKVQAKEVVEDYNTRPMTRDCHIYNIFSLFIMLSGVELRKEAGRMVYRHNEYLSCSRYILFKLVNKLRNFDFALNNWTLVNYMEYCVEDFLENNKLANSSKLLNNVDTKMLVLLRQNRTGEVVAYLKGQMSRLFAYLRFSMDQDYDPNNVKENEVFDLNEALTQLKTKEYFFSFKPLAWKETGTNSRHITIFVSSFLNQAEDQDALWKEYLEGEPYTESYAFLWPTMDTYSYNEIKIQMEHQYKDNNVKSDMFHIGVNLLTKNLIKALKLEKLDMEPFYSNLYYMALLSGKALAFFIGQLKLFETSTVTLVGYSMGAVVAYNCLRDLYFMKKSNIIFNYVQIGSPICKNSIDPEIVKMSVGSFFNVFSMDDKVLKYMSSMVPFLNNPCGLNELVYDGSLYAAKNIKVSNLDMTPSVHCHMDYTKCFKKIVDHIRKVDDYHSLSNYMFT